VTINFISSLYLLNYFSYVIFSSDRKALEVVSMVRKTLGPACISPNIAKPLVDQK